MKKIWVLFFILIFVLPAVIAQPIRGLTTNKKIRIAEEQRDMGNTYNALEWYEKAYEEDNTNLDVIENIAELHNQLRDYENAEKWYDRLVRKDKNNEYRLAKFELGQILKKNEKYSDAVTMLQDYVAESQDDKYRTLAQAEILGAELAQELENSKNLLEVSNIGTAVNSPSSEMSPVYASNETFYYASLPANEVKLTEEAGYAKIFKSSKNPDGTWGEGAALHPNVNTGHTVHPALSADGSTMYYTRCVLSGNAPSQCDLYSSESLGDGNWSLGEKIEGLNMEGVSSKQATVASVNNQDALVFVSDRPGGMGGWDIYYAVMNRNGSFDAPVNAGAINTIGDDITPFFHDGSLYFSSDGHPTIGGLDVFSASWLGSEFGNVENMGKGINSSVDDFYYSLDKRGFNGFVVSNRPGTVSLKSETCCDDIFGLKFRIPIDIIALTFDADTRADLSGTTVTLTPMPSGDGDAKTNENSNDFRYKDVDRSMMYKLEASADGYENATAEVSLEGLDEETSTEVKLLLKPIPPPPEFKYVYVSFDTIYYDFDKFNIREDAAATLDEIANTLTQYPQLMLETASHTDALGTNLYNDSLSVWRTNSAIKYLVEKGIAPERLSPMSYGEYRPVAPNKNDNGTDNPDGRQLNRRTEFRILSGAEEGGKIKVPADDSTGDVTPPPAVEEIMKNGIAEMTFDKDFHDFGTMKQGEKKNIPSASLTQGK
ncbi:MAG: OmpA family protein [Bacteroidota bacterium]